MRPFETLATAVTPDGRELTLHRRDRDYFIQLDGDELMSTRRHQSERALAELACRRLQQARAPRILIGGLGLGYTLRAALELLPTESEVVVAEVFAAVVEWNRTFLAEVAGPTLSDPRVRVDERDVWAVLGDTGRYDAILLDVDNGPHAWCLDSNSRLYETRGLERIGKVLTPGGTLAIWSARSDGAFARRLKSGGYSVETEVIRAHGSKGPKHAVILARR